MQKGYYIISLIALALIGGAFYGGYKYGVSKAPSGRGGAAGNFVGRNGAGGNRQFGGGAGGAGLAGGAVRGNVLSKDASTITLQLDNNAGSKIILYSPSTTVSTMTETSVNSLATGENIMIRGTQNSDGSITASSIQVIPASSTFRGNGN